MRGCSRGACVVAWGACIVQGACMVLLGGMHGFIWGGVHGFIWGGVHGLFSFFGYNEIRSMSRRYASYWNAFLFKKHLNFFKACIKNCMSQFIDQ